MASQFRSFLRELSTKQLPQGVVVSSWKFHQLTCHQSVMRCHERRGACLNRFYASKSLVSQNVDDLPGHPLLGEYPSSWNIAPIHSSRNNNNNNKKKNYSKTLQNMSDPNTLHDFVQSWMSTKDLLLNIKLGSWQSRHWFKVEELINALRTNPHLSNMSNRVELMFSVLDRLCDEVEFWKSFPGRRLLPVSLPLSGECFGRVLLAWRNHILSTFRLNNASSSTRESSAKQRPKISESPSFLLTTDSVLQRVERYVSAGLFDPHLVPYNIILHVKKKVDDPQKVPYQAQKIYQTLLDKSNYDPFDRCYHPTEITINEMIDIWTQSGLLESPNRIDQYLFSLKQWYRQTGRHDMKPTAYIFCSAMEAHSRCNEPRSAFRRIRQLFVEMKDTCLDSEINTMTYSRVCHALAMCDHPDSPDAARSILNEMCSRYFEAEANNNNTTIQSLMIKPNQHIFSAVITCYARAGRSDDAVEIFNLMETMANKTGDPSLRPNAITYASLIWALARAGNMQQAETMLVRLIEGSEQASRDLLETNAVDGVLTAFAQSGHPNAPKFISNMIDRLQKLSKEQNITGLVSVSTYNKLLCCYAARKEPEKAAALFNWMQQQQQQHQEHHVEGETNVSPNIDSWFNLILAWCNAGRPDQGEAVLRNFCCSYHQREDKDRVLLDPRLFNIVIKAWGKVASWEAAERASGVLQLMEDFGTKPDVECYTSLMFAWANANVRDPVKPVEDIFHRMLKQYNDGGPFAKPNEASFNALLVALSRSTDPQALDRADVCIEQMNKMGIQPNAKHYNTIMIGWSKHNNPMKVESYFQKLKNLLQSGVGLTPNVQVHVTRLQAWSKAGNPEMASRALQEWIEETRLGRHHRQLKDFGEDSEWKKPTTREFNAVLKSWLLSNHPNAAEQAELGLREMFRLSASTNQFECHPNVFSYNMVISAYAKSCKLGSQVGSQRAMALFQELKQQMGEASNNGPSRERGLLLLEPNLMTYVETILALAHSQNVGIDNSTEIRQLLKELQTKPKQFWNDKRRTNQALEKISWVLGSSSFPSKHDLLAEFHQVTLVASQKALT